MRNCWQIHLLGRSIVVANPHYAVRRYISVGGNDDVFQITPLGVIFNAIYIVGNSIFIILFFYVLVFLIIFKPARMFNYTK